MCIRTDNKNSLSENILISDTLINELKLQAMENIESETEQKTIPSETEPDTLAVLTSHQRKFVDVMHQKVEEAQDSKFYKILFGTTQPAHIISVITVSSVVSLLYTSSSEQIKSTRNGSSSSSLLSSPPSSMTMIIYLVAVCVHFGSQFWMTFVSGLSLYFSLPRHAFGDVQKVLFPKYFSLNTFLSAVTLIAFNRLNYPWNSQKILQEVTLSVCFLLELIVRLYIVPPLIRLITAKTEVEIRAGVGQEIGYHDPGSLKFCPYYKGLHKNFRQVHLCVAIVNIIALICTALHLQYLAHHIITYSYCQDNN